MRQHPFYGELLITERQREIEHLCTQQRLRAALPRPQTLSRLIVFIGTWIVMVGTSMQQAEVGKA